MAKTTQNYVEDLLKLYGRVVRIGSGNAGGLVEIKSLYLSFCEDVEVHNMFAVSLEKPDRAFLETPDVTDLPTSHKRLETIVRNQFLMNIHGNLLGKGVGYYFNWFHKNWTRFNLRYWSPSIVQPTEKASAQARRQEPPTVDKAYYRKLLAELARKHSDLKKALPRRRAVSKSTKEELQGVIERSIAEYERVVNRDFFQIRHLFRWYSKEIRTYLCNHFGRGRESLLLHVYPSETRRIKVYPYLLNAFLLEYNAEALAGKSESMIYTTGPVNKGERISRLFLGIEDTTPTPYVEALKAFWLNCSLEQKITLIGSIARLLGHRPKSSQSCQGVLDLVPLDPAFERQPIFTKSRPVRFLVAEKSYFTESDVRQALIGAGLRPARRTVSPIHLVGRYFTGRTETLKRWGVRMVTLDELAGILVERRVYRFLIPELVAALAAFDKGQIRATFDQRTKGENLVERFQQFDPKQGSWRQFEILMEEIVEFLFMDSFKKYYAKPQAVELGTRKRRDLLIVNIGALNDFWKEVKREYHARLIVVDFKNYSSEIGPDVIHSLVKYLDARRGGFALLISKHNLGRSARDEQKRKLHDNNQLVLDVNSAQLIQMIYHKMNGMPPEEILEKRLSTVLMR